MSPTNESALTLRQLRAFDALATEGSFTRAAQRMHVTQSALSLLIRDIEQLLRTSLFDRTTRWVRLTDAGRAFQPRVRRLLNELAEAAAEVADIRDSRMGVLRLAAPQLMGSTVVPAVLEVFHVRYPEIEIRLHDAPADQVRQRVVAAETELAIGPDADQDLPELERHLITTDRHWLACRPGDVPADVMALRWRDLAGLRFIAPTREFTQQMRRILDTAAEPLLREPQREVSYFTTAFGLAASGFGVTICPTYAHAMARGYGLRIVALEEPHFYRGVCVWSRKDTQWSPAAASFVHTLRELVASRHLFTPPDTH